MTSRRMSPPRDDRLLPPPDGSDDELPLGFVLLGDLRQGPAHQRSVLGESGTDHDDLALGHAMDLVGAGEVEQLEDLLGRLRVGVDHEVGARRGPRTSAASSPRSSGASIRTMLRSTPTDFA